MTDEQGQVVDTDLSVKRQYRRPSPVFIVSLIAFLAIGTLVVLPLLALLNPAEVKLRLAATFGLVLALPSLIYWIRCYMRWHDYIEVDEFGITSVTRSTKHTIVWNEIGEIHPRQMVPDGYLELSDMAGRSSIRAYYALKGFDDLILEIAIRTQRRTRVDEPHGYFGLEQPFRPVLRLLFWALVFGVAGLVAWMGDHVIVMGVCLVVAGALLSLAIFRTLLAKTRTVISQDVITVEKAFSSQSWAFRDIEDVRIGLTPGDIKNIDVRIFLVGGRNRGVITQGADPVSLFNSLRAAIGSGGGGFS